jgi:hypothetical protein
MNVSVELPSAIEMARRFIFESANGSSCRSRGGRQIDEMDAQLEKAYPSMEQSLESDSNVTSESDVHREKHFPPSFSTGDGMQIDEMDTQSRNASVSITESLDPGSNTTLESLLHSAKHSPLRAWTDEGMEIDKSDVQRQNDDQSRLKSFEPASNVIPTRAEQAEKQ